MSKTIIVFGAALLLFGCEKEVGTGASGTSTTGDATTTTDDGGGSTGATGDDTTGGETTGGETTGSETTGGETTATGTTDGGTDGVDCEAEKKASIENLVAAAAPFLACDQHSQCDIVSIDTDCHKTCGAAVNTEGQTAMAELVSEEQTRCEELGFVGQCGEQAVPPCVPPMPGCYKGECVSSLHECPEDSFPTSPKMAAGMCAEATCEAMSETFQALIAETVKANLSCASDSDCLINNASMSCQGDCGHAINATGSDALNDMIGWIDAQICDAKDYAGTCGFAEPGCIEPKPGCQDGQCVYNKDDQPVPGCLPDQFKPYMSADCVDATCDAMLDSVQETIAAAVEGQQFCKNDDNCTVVDTSTHCAGTCGVPLNKMFAAELQTALSWMDSNICIQHGFQEMCPFATPDCAPPNPGCGPEGQCVYAK